MRFIAKQLLVTFVLAQMLGLLAGALFYSQQVSVVENPSDPANAAYFVVGILISTSVMLLLIKFYKGNMVFKLVEFLLVFSAFDIIFSLITNESVALILAAVIASMRFAVPAVRQWLILAASIIVGGLLGASLDFLPVFIFVVALMIYDFIAVFITKHMITLAKGMDAADTPFTIQFSLPGQAKQKTAGKIVQKTKTGKLGPERIQLGTGDFVIPIVIAVSASVAYGTIAGLFSIAGATIGLFALFWIMEKRKGYYPGLPAIVGGALVFLGLFALKSALIT